MIVTCVLGGLGNLTSRYATGLAAQSVGVELLLDLATFETYRLHAHDSIAWDYELNIRAFAVLGPSSERCRNPATAICCRVGGCG